jgi:hypothetical protein
VGYQGKEGISGVTSMVSVMRDERNGEGEAMGCGHFQRGEARRSTVPEADDTMNSSTAAGEAEGSPWCLEVKDDQSKLG